MAMVFDDQRVLKYPYFAAGQPLTWPEGVTDYVARSAEGLRLGPYEPGWVDFRNPHPVHEFQWSLSEVVTALVRAGLILQDLREYPYSNGFRIYDDMRTLPGRRYSMPEGVPSLPLMYSIVAHKPS